MDEVRRFFLGKEGVMFSLCMTAKEQEIFMADQLILVELENTAPVSEKLLPPLFLFLLMFAFSAFDLETQLPNLYFLFY